MPQSHVWPVKIFPENDVDNGYPCTIHCDFDAFHVCALFAFYFSLLNWHSSCLSDCASRVPSNELSVCCLSPTWHTIDDIIGVYSICADWQANTWPNIPGSCTTNTDLHMPIRAPCCVLFWTISIAGFDRDVHATQHCTLMCKCSCFICICWPDITFFYIFMYKKAKWKLLVWFRCQGTWFQCQSIRRLEACQRVKWKRRTILPYG